jgi:hypothetical protein
MYVSCIYVLCTYACICVYYVCMHACMCMYYARICVCMYVCTYVYVYMYVYEQIHELIGNSQHITHTINSLRVNCSTSPSLHSVTLP